MYIQDYLKNILREVLLEMGIGELKNIQLEHPHDLNHGDFATNIAMQLSKETQENPRSIAETIVKKIKEKNIPNLDSVELAGPGFINFKLSQNFLTQSIKDICERDSLFSKRDENIGKKILIEHSSPNLFKPFHIGHMMNNAIGESIVRLYRYTGWNVTAISYPSDVSLGIAKAVWFLLKDNGMEKLEKMQSLDEQIAYLGACYTNGTRAYKENSDLEVEVRKISDEIYQRKDTSAYQAYLKGKEINLNYFLRMAAKLGSSFDDFIFESEAGEVGKKLVLAYLNQVFTESDGAIVYEISEGEKEKDGSLHTRVFLNKEKQPTYEAKDLGLLKIKFERYEPDISLFVTDSEQENYFKVVSHAAAKINPIWSKKTIHKTHGRMKFKGEKMSSRLGNTPIVSDILATVDELVQEKASGKKVLNEAEREVIAIAALKYAILRIQSGKAINFDPDTSLSFEGDSGPYLLYHHARSRSLLRRAEKEGIEKNFSPQNEWKGVDFERYLYRFEEVVEEARDAQAPHILAHYLMQIAQIFNAWYARGKIFDTENIFIHYEIALIEAFSRVLREGLFLLGIDVLEEM